MPKQSNFKNSEKKSIQEVTDQLQTKEHLSLFKKVVESSTDAIGISLSDGRHWYQNTAFDNLFGEIGEDPPASLYCDVRVGREVFETIMEGGEWIGEVQMFGIDGNVLDIFLRAYAFLNNNGEILGLVGVHTDITERKQMERALRLTQFSFDNAPVGIYLIGTGRIILEVNDAAAVMIGYSREELIKMTIYDIDPYTPMFDDETFWRLPREDKCFEAVHQRKDGREFPVEVNGKLFEYEGQQYAIIFVQDITERKLMEERIIQSEKMLSVGGLAAGMAHEINNPLAGLMQSAQVMAQRLRADANIPANQKAAEAAGTTMESIEQFMGNRGIQKMIEAITESGQRISEIVTNMLSFARRDDINLSARNLNEILDKTIELAATDYDFKRIEIIREYDENLPDVPCQSSKIQQVLLNILTNGAQAMQDAGTPKARFIIRTYVDSVRSMACMEIEDNGPGMDEKTRKHIFDPFFTTKPEGMGIGLGLSVSYFIITENHKGEMTLKSIPREGAKFIIRLPL